VPPALPFIDSRRLTGGNLYFATTGAVLDVVGAPVDEALLAAWRSRSERAGARLKWPQRKTVARRHRGGITLAITAPYDQLFLATEVNEWALCAALFERDPMAWRGLEEALIEEATAATDATAPADPHFIKPVMDEAAAFDRFERLAAAESKPRLRALLEEAAARDLPQVLDEEQLTLGAGAGGLSFALDALPDVREVRWDTLRNIPTALVTGSNGKTTTVRLLAACARAHGLKTGYNCTDGVFLDDESLALGDYSGPAGARMVMRDRRTEAAVLETARGGILRRGIAVSHAQTAVVTNVSADHFGEYGIDDLAGLADVKLAVAGLVAPHGLLVVNADDGQLRARMQDLMQRFGRRPPLGWFAWDADADFLREQRAAGVATCGVRGGRLCMSLGGVDHDLGPIAVMPLTVAGVARYNIANLAAAALAATALGIAPAIVASVFARFGSRREDNPGRMMQFERAGVKVLIDYAHNPDGLRGLLTVADHLREHGGRLGMLLGHAGNRSDADIEELARVAAEFHPALIVVKENETQLRGRAPGDVPRIIRAQLLRSGLLDAALPMRNSEVEAARFSLEWARPGDVLALPLHSASARAAVMAMLAT
jgi:cyanophycin synthetase